MPKRYEDLPLKEVKELFKKSPPNVKIRVYYGNEEEQDVIMKPPRKKNKYTMSQVCTKLDLISDALLKFIKTTNERFDRIEARIDGIEARLDYNDLKPLPKERR